MFESEKDFDCIHPVHHSTRSLRIYLIARGIKQKSVVTKDELIALVQTLIQQERSTMPPLLPADTAKATYLQSDKLFVTDGGAADAAQQLEQLPSLIYSMHDVLFAQIRDPQYLLPIEEELLSNLYVEFDMGIAFQWRVTRLFHGGHVDLSSMKAREAFIRKNETSAELIPAFVIYCDVVASMKSKTHTCCLVFQKPCTGSNLVLAQLLTTRVSRCTCEAGRWLCSHMLATLLLLRQIQKFNYIGYDDMIIHVLPERVKLVTAQLLPAAFLYPIPKALSMLEGNN
jgi:hypothetical protein